MVMSGMNRSFTELVTHQAQFLFSSRMWEFCGVQGLRRLGRSETALTIKKIEYEFKPLAMEHDGKHTDCSCGHVVGQQRSYGLDLPKGMTHCLLENRSEASHSLSSPVDFVIIVAFLCKTTETRSHG